MLKCTPDQPGQKVFNYEIETPASIGVNTVNSEILRWMCQSSVLNQLFYDLPSLSAITMDITMEKAMYTVS